MSKRLSSIQRDHKEWERTQKRREKLRRRQRRRNYKKWQRKLDNSDIKRQERGLPGLLELYI